MSGEHYCWNESVPNRNKKSFFKPSLIIKQTVAVIRYCILNRIRFVTVKMKCSFVQYFV